MGKQGIATATTNPMFDREVNQFSTAAKLVHLHHSVLMEFDGPRRNRKLGGNLEFLSDVTSAPSRLPSPLDRRSRLVRPLVSSRKGDESPAFQSGMDVHD